jgi:hypothetical protein
MGDFQWDYPQYKFNPENYEEPTGPAFGGAFVQTPQPDPGPTPSPMIGVQQPVSPVIEQPAQPFTIDTNVPVQRAAEVPIQDLYKQRFGHSPEAASTGVSDYAAQPTAAAVVQAPAAPQGLSTDDALAIAGASQGGMYRDPAAVARVQKLQGERAGMYEQGAQALEKQGAASAALQDQIAGELRAKSDVAARWAAEETKRQAERQEDGKRFQAEIAQKQNDATEAAANLDGNRLMQGGSGVLMMLGMAAGAFGASLTKTPNFALTIVQNALDRDLEGQRENVRGKREAVSFAREMYQGFRDQGRDELESRMATRAAMYEAVATKVDALAQQAGAGDRKAAYEAQARELRMGANGEALGAAQLAAKPRGTKQLTPQQIAENALKLQGQSLDNATKANKLAEGGDNKAGPAATESIQKDLESLKVTGTLHSDAKDWQRQGYSNLPGQGGVQDVPHDVAKGFKKVFGGSGETPLETRLRVGPKALGNQIFRSNTGQSANTPQEQADALAAGTGNGTTEGFIELTQRQAKAQIANVQARIDQLPANSRERRVAQAQLDAEKVKFSAPDPEEFRRRFGSK